MMLRFVSCAKAEHASRFPFTISNLEDCFRLGRNYTLAVTETVRRSKLLHLTPREYPASDKYVKRNYSSPWYRRDQAALVTVCRRSDICLGSTTRKSRHIFGTVGWGRAFTQIAAGL